MKNNHLITLAFLFIATLSFAQHAGQSIGLNGPSGDHVIGADNADFDITIPGFTVEMWARPTLNVTDDQKLMSKAAGTFPLVTSFDLGDVAPGIYTVQIQSGERVSNKRISIY